MHIPDGFLSTPVWAALDIAAAPSVAYIARRAQRGFEESRAPLLGVLGAFVFAAQIINFPVGPGTTAHLVGGALLSFTLGPAAASVAMTAILAIQALVFQDGGVLALGTNIVNMALVGVAAGYLPYALWGGGPRRRLAMFAGGVLSVLSSALLALSELAASGVKMSGGVLATAMALFFVSAILEGAITVAVIEAIERIQPRAARHPASPMHLEKPRFQRSPLPAMIGLAALLLSTVGVLLASTQPDGIQRLGERTGIAARVRMLLHTPLSNYHASFLQSDVGGKVLAGLAGIALVYAACVLVGRAFFRRAVVRNRSI
ncbi:MAG TPA: energy-coupling factor ABC transporter permease [Bryobacteraceae bacterium]|nr:energy-coupling factor ABC transporter permease [Bryobacteraceae bacterium]